ncbi:pilus assembly protein [Aquabacterium sp.]|uniref:pilus assembly protein n=1 Tax=Aquabacterium sp. TaxID=1872578 RepID=UPI0035B43868
MKKAQASVSTAAPRIATLSLLIGAMFASPGVHAQATDISNTPLANTSDIAAKPNMMLVLDDSGSMAWSFMPDDLGQTSQGQTASDSTALNRYGGLSAQCNGVAYNPNFNYSGNLPLQADGTPYPHQNFSAAMDDGFQMNLTGTTRSSTTSVTMGTGDLTFKLSGTPYSTTVGSTIGIVSTSDVTRWMIGTIKSWNSTTLTLVVTVSKVVGSGTYASWRVGNPISANLNNAVYYRYTGTQPALSWTFSPTTLWHVVNTFSNECLSTIGNSPGSSVFTPVTVTASSAEAQNYADWYAYYRKRFLMMRSVTGQAFNGLTTKYRVGFTTISNTGVSSSSSTFLDVKDFDATQKATFYRKVYAADVGGSTPLRGALSKVGRYYAKKVQGQTYDPMQYACQRNYTLMSTDGYWNTGSETSTYTGLQLDGTTMVGQQDGSETPPRWDGQKAKVTTTTPYSTVIHQQAVYNRSYTYSVTGATYKTWTTSGCSGGKKKLITYSGVKGTEVDAASVTDSEDVSGTTTQTVVTLNGVVQSTTYSTPSSSGSPSVTGSSVGSQSFSSFSMTSSTGSTTGSCTSSFTSDSVSGGTKTLASTSDGSKTRTVLSQSPVAATGASTVASSGYVGGEGNTLADIAEYYYVTDLRAPELGNCVGALGTDVCNDEVPPGGGDNDVNSKQHMTTFTMGLGVGGILTYDRNYLTQTSGDYFNLRQGTISWPIPSMSGGGDPTNVDDLWHAAVNGRGQYFATTDPTSLADAINTVLTSVTKATGSSAAASTTSLMPVQGQNNLVFVATYTTLEWTGDLKALTLHADTGAIDSTPVWSVQGKVDAVTPSTRAVYYLQPGGVTTNPRAFTAANLSADGYASYFTGMCSKATIPDQCASLTSTQKAKANDMTNLVNYLRGDRTYENYTDTSVSPAQTLPIYRARTHLLGDIIDASPAYVGKPPLSYTDNGYADFVTAQSSRKPMVYVAANDGMLHAFSADGSDAGSELWAYVPSFVMQNMYLLADTNYANNHHYFVDGSPVVGDIYVGGAWKTILVGGLNSGGRGYYCLDITNPTSPKTLWEFTDTNMGLTYGNPVITKRKDGTWVVAFTSGYNNTSGDGNGHLYVVNANTGVLLKNIPTYTSGALPAGTSSAPNNLGKLDMWTDDAKNNTAARYYAGDMLGNLWRFDIDGVVSPNNAALLLANFSAGGTPQPITTMPVPAMVTSSSTNYPIVVVGTGRYLGLTDIADKTTETIYAIKDTLTGSGWGGVRSRSDLVTQTMTETTLTSGANIGAKVRMVTANTVDWSTKIGWKLDLLSAGERIVVDFGQQFSTLTMVSTIPGVDECRPSGGTSWLYNLNLSNGSALSTAADGAAGTFLGNSIAVGITVIELPNGSVSAITQLNNGDINVSGVSNNGAAALKPATRTSWRELAN